MNNSGETGEPLTWRNSWILLISYPMMIVPLYFGESLVVSTLAPSIIIVLFIAVFFVMLISSFSVVRHAERLAYYLGEPYGTLILTLSVVIIEVAVIASVMLHGENNPTLARDTIFSVLMIVLNGVVGLSLFVGGVRHFEQSYNLRGANAYLGVLIPLSLLGLVLPRLTDSAPGGRVSEMLGIYLMVSTTLLYVIFLGIQTTRHRDLFRGGDTINYVGDGDQPDFKIWGPCILSALLLIVTMVPIVVLAETLAEVVDHAIEKTQVPAALGGALVAVLVLSAEGISALKAARSDQLQRSINISLGAALSTIGLTIPCVIGISIFLNEGIVLGLNWLDVFLLNLTLMVSIVTFGSGRTGVLQGAVHLLLFATYLVSMFDSAA